MNTQTITRPPVVGTHAPAAAARAVERADDYDPNVDLRSIYRAFRWAEAAGNAPGISDDQVDALADQAGLIWSMIARAEITSVADAIIKLEVAQDTLDLNGLTSDAALLRQVAVWLRGGLN